METIHSLPEQYKDKDQGCQAIKTKTNLLIINHMICVRTQERQAGLPHDSIFAPDLIYHKMLLNVADILLRPRHTMTFWSTFYDVRGNVGNRPWSLVLRQKSFV